MLVRWLFIVWSLSADCNGGVLDVSYDNATQLFDGSWVVLFYAPWCPVCESLKETFKAVGLEIEQDKGVKFLSVAQIDVSSYPALSGQFLIFNLPTIYRIDNGLCRHYNGLKDLQSIKQWVTGDDWNLVEPVPAWRSPNSHLLRLVGQFFHFSSYIRELKNSLAVEYGIPLWAVYGLFIVCTVAVGTVLGLTVVCLCDVFCPPKKSKEESVAASPKSDEAEDLADTTEKKKEKTEGKTPQKMATNKKTNAKQSNMPVRKRK